jgi:hypothetical protein
MLLGLSLLASACGYFSSGIWEDDPKNWKRAWGYSKPEEVVMPHSWYWRSPHWTREEPISFRSDGTRTCSSNGWERMGCARPNRRRVRVIAWTNLSGSPLRRLQVTRGGDVVRPAIAGCSGRGRRRSFSCTRASLERRLGRRRIQMSQPKEVPWQGGWETAYREGRGAISCPQARRGFAIGSYEPGVAS